MAKNRLQTNGAASGRVSFAIDPATNQAALTQGDRVTNIDLTKTQSPSPEVLAGQTQTLPSLAEQWLDEIENEFATGPQIEKRVFGGREWFIQRGASEEITKCGLWSARDASGQLNLLQSGTFTRFQAALLFVFLVSSENDLKPHFPDFATASRQSASRNPKVVDVNARLFAEIIALNPGVLPRGEQKADGSEVPESDPLAQTPVSSTR